MTSRPSVRITVGELVLTGLPVANPGALGDAVGERLTRLVTERGFPDTVDSGPVTARVDGPAGLADALAEAIWSRLDPSGGVS